MSAGAMYALIGAVLITAIGSTAWLVSQHSLDPAVFAGIVTGSVTGVLALLNPQFPKAPAPPTPPA